MSTHLLVYAVFVSVASVLFESSVKEFFCFATLVIFIQWPLGRWVLSVIDRGRQAGEGARFIMSVPIGLVLVGALFNVAYVLGVPPQIIFLILSVPGVYGLRKIFSNQWPKLSLQWSSETFMVWIVISLSFLVIVAQGFVNIHDHHLIQAYIANMTQSSQWPIDNITVEGTPFFYNYVFHANIGFLNLLTGTEATVFVSRLSVIFYFPLTLLAFYLLLRQFINSWVIRILALVQVFWVSGHKSPMLTYFAHVIPVSMSFTVSTMIGIYIYFILSMIILNLLGEARKRIDGVAIVMWLLLFFAITGLRSSVLPVLGCALFGYGLHLKSRQSENFINAVLLCVLICVSFVGGLFWFYGLGQPISAVRSVSFGIIGTSVAFLKTTAMWGPFAAFFVMIVTRFTLLVPGFLGLRRVFQQEPTSYFFLYTYITGILVVFSISHYAGGSEYTFFHYGHCMMAVVLAMSLERLFPLNNKKKQKALWNPVKVTTFALLVIHVGISLYFTRWQNLETVTRSVGDFQSEMEVFTKNRDHLVGKTMVVFAPPNIFLTEKLATAVNGVKFFGNMVELGKYTKKATKDSRLFQRRKLKSVFWSQLQKGEVIDLDQFVRASEQWKLGEKFVFVFDRRVLQQRPLSQSYGVLDESQKYQIYSLKENI